MNDNFKIQSDDISALGEALAKAQGKIDNAKKDKTNPFFKSKYADLESVWEACRASLCENGLSVVQTMQMMDGESVLVTTLLHSSGQWIRSWLPIRPVKSDPQGLGACITYMKRYALAAIVGVATEDDDAESAMDRTPKTNGNVQKKQVITEKQYQDFEEALGDNMELRNNIRAYMENTYKVSAFNMMPLEMYHMALSSALKQKQKKAVGE